MAVEATITGHPRKGDPEYTLPYIVVVYAYSIYAGCRAFVHIDAHATLALAVDNAKMIRRRDYQQEKGIFIYHNEDKPWS